jgi:quinol monooxygenase YgiN
MKPGCTLTATIVARPEHRDEVLSILQSFVEPTRAEEGCINYDLHSDANDPNVFMFYENWSTKEDLDRHSKMEHLKPLGARADVILARPVEIRFFHMITNLDL